MKLSSLAWLLILLLPISRAALPASDEPTRLSSGSETELASLLGTPEAEIPVSPDCLQPLQSHISVFQSELPRANRRVHKVCEGLAWMTKVGLCGLSLTAALVGLSIFLTVLGLMSLYVLMYLLILVFS